MLLSEPELLLLNTFKKKKVSCAWYAYEGVVCIYEFMGGSVKLVQVREGFCMLWGFDVLGRIYFRGDKFSS